MKKNKVEVFNKVFALIVAMCVIFSTVIVLFFYDKIGKAFEYISLISIIIVMSIILVSLIFSPFIILWIRLQKNQLDKKDKEK